jgi:hypothetical protein
MKYNFVSLWTFEGEEEKLWSILMDIHSWPKWWTGMRKVVQLSKNSYCITVGYFFYKLTYTVVVVRKSRSKSMNLTSTGDLSGVGKFLIKRQSGNVVVKFEWNVKANKGLMRRSEFLLHPFFRFAHNIIVEWGAKGLARYSGLKLLSTKVS